MQYSSTETRGRYPAYYYRVMPVFFVNKGSKNYRGIINLDLCRTYVHDYNNGMALPHARRIHSRLLHAADTLLLLLNMYLEQNCS